MTIYEQKLSSLDATIALAAHGPITALASALQGTSGATVIAVGSGGSAVAADYLARCRSTLGLGATLCYTPMEFVMGGDAMGEEVWLFSAGADNPDVAAAFEMARRKERTVRLISVRPEGATAKAVRAYPRGLVVILPVAEAKDGFLATHSLAATITALLAASAQAIGTVDPGGLLDRFRFMAAERLSQGRTLAGDFHPGDTIVVMHDPQLRAIATLLETSLWETGIAPAQRVDFRNFAHGRHVWAARHPDTMLILSLFSADTQQIWRSIAASLPSEIRRTEMICGTAGRFEVALGVIAGLAIVGAWGEIAGIDPGRPGSGDFARPIYEDSSLLAFASALKPNVLHKRNAVLAYDEQQPAVSLCEAGSDRMRRLGIEIFQGLVLDYDGTIVETEVRFDPPARDVLDEIVRLVDGGLRLGIATGRGGSAGEALRTCLPGRVHSSILVGYYNGGFIRPLDVDIRSDMPLDDQDLRELFGQLEQEDLLVEGAKWKWSPIQITVDHAKLRTPSTFPDRVSSLAALQDGRLRLLKSQHSYDIVPAATSKRRVIDAVRAKPSDVVLCLGDSGCPGGNDHELLQEYLGISVGSVCGGVAGCWSLFGDELTGPKALLQIFKAMRVTIEGMMIDTRVL